VEEIAFMEKLLSNVRDWNYLTRLAIDHGIGPLLHHKIPMLSNQHLIPAEAKNRLFQSYMRTLARSMHLYEAFREVGTALNLANIKFVVLKGVYLAEKLYQDIGLRLFSDIDLLVAEEDGEKSLEVLKKLGFKSTSEKVVHSPFVEKHLRFVHFPPMVKGDVSVEIHIKLHASSPDYCIDIHSILRDAQTVCISGIDTYTLQNDDLLIFLAVHTDKHFKNGHFQIKGYGDILNSIDSTLFNHEIFLNRCQLHQCEKIVLKHILLILKLTSQPFEKYNLNEYKSFEDKSAIFKFLEFYRGKITLPNPADTLKSDLNSIKDFKSKVRFVWNVIHPDKAFMLNRYKIKNPVYYRAYYFVRYWEGLKALFRKITT
jgi:hypothetical protein